MESNNLILLEVSSSHANISIITGTAVNLNTIASSSQIDKKVFKPAKSKLQLNEIL